MNYPEIRYLERLADLYPTIASASTEVINMEAILNLLPTFTGKMKHSPMYSRTVPDPCGARSTKYSEIPCPIRTSAPLQH